MTISDCTLLINAHCFPGGGRLYIHTLIGKLVHERAPVEPRSSGGYGWWCLAWVIYTLSSMLSISTKGAHSLPSGDSPSWGFPPCLCFNCVLLHNLSMRTLKADFILIICGSYQQKARLPINKKRVFRRFWGRHLPKWCERCVYILMQL